MMRSESINLNASFWEPANSIPIVVPPAFICFLMTSRSGWESSPGYRTDLIALWFSRNSAIVCALSAIRVTRKSIVSRDFTKTQALKALSDGPVWRVNGINFS